MWAAAVAAPQGGPTWMHHFEGETPSEILREIADALDLSSADSVSITFERVEEEPAPVVCHVQRDRFALLRAADKVRAERGPVKIGRVFPPEGDDG